jgi:hypothetical protein
MFWSGVLRVLSSLEMDAVGSSDYVHICPPNLQRHVPEDTAFHVYVQYCANKKMCTPKLCNTSYFTKYGIKCCNK